MDELDISLRNGVRIIRLNNVKKKNAISAEGYQMIGDTLNQDALNDEVKITVITGTGDFFTSGNNLTKVAKQLETKSLEEVINLGTAHFENMIKAFHDYPKLIITVVNGPALGVGVTICGLSDITYASDTATFQTPFVKIGLCIEGCGSFSLPFILGKSKANEVLLLGHKMTAAEALNFGFIAKIIPFKEIDSFIKGLEKFGDIPLESLILNKKLITANFKDALLECCKREIIQLKECQKSPLFFNSFMTFNEKKSKL